LTDVCSGLAIISCSARGRDGSQTWLSFWHNSIYGESSFELWAQEMDFEQAGASTSQATHESSEADS